MRGITKGFPGVRALDGVDLDVRAGEVHCLMGQNGAGKSTLIKVLAGAHRPDAGTITWEGAEVSFADPRAAMRCGVATIYQELDLVPGLSVADNIHLDRMSSPLRLLRRQRSSRTAADLLRRLGHPEIRPGTEVGELPAASQQMVSMARALSQDARLIVMDEPSAVLDTEEVQHLFGVVRDLTAAGVAVVWISHRLEEIRQIGDRITVLKDGRTVASGLPARTTATHDLIALMTGRSIDSVFPERAAAPLPDDDGPAPVLEVEDLALRGAFEGVSFSVRPGEVLGLAGLVGSGRSEVLETVAGARRATSGAVRVGGRALRRGDVASAVAAGVGLAPEERKSQALLMGESIAANTTLASLARFARAGFLDRGAEVEAAREQARALDLRPVDVAREVRTLSGGNQQKVVLARWLLRDCRVLLLDEPTRGVDVGARAEIYALVRSLADRGVAVVLVSSEIPEVLGLADRVLVLADGRVVATARAEELDEHRVLDLVMEQAPRSGAAADGSAA
ncbi:sugar ABC transporter ATP-binding protein [Quadrisphaera sp. KR29]|uniref:sugar ABC transporter ATP-binding protein n=1 Tax=Quadrisphaera sp. KR29 TaxID=3461391 RepID=UPI004043BBE9